MNPSRSLRWLDRAAEQVSQELEHRLEGKRHREALGHKIDYVVADVSRSLEGARRARLELRRGQLRAALTALEVVSPWLRLEPWYELARELRCRLSVGSEHPLMPESATIPAPAPLPR